MIRLTCYIRPHQLEDVKTALAELPISGLSVTDARGCGNSPEVAKTIAGQEMLIPLPVRSKVVVVAPAELQEELIEAVINSAQTGEPGDGKLFVERVERAIRIRTGEENELAV